MVESARAPMNHATIRARRLEGNHLRRSIPLPQREGVAAPCGACRTGTGLVVVSAVVSVIVIVLVVIFAGRLGWSGCGGSAGRRCLRSGGLRRRGGACRGRPSLVTAAGGSSAGRGL